MTWRDTIPESYIKVRPNLKDIIEKYGLVLNPYAEFKLEWMEKHGGQCYCEPDGTRHCPCPFILSDLHKFNGSCLCTLVVTKERLQKIEKYKSKPVKTSELDMAKKKEKERDAKALFNKLYSA